MPIVLASTSPRRKYLLEKAGVIFKVVPSPAEEIHDAAMAPSFLCELNAGLKADAVALMHPEATVIGADTLVFIDGLALGKPRSLAEAKVMLRRLSGRSHQVCTGVCIVVPQGERHLFHELTEVIFRELEDEEIDVYFTLVNPLDKAGGYGIQEHGERIVAEIRGNFENVMGLPVQKLIEALG